MSAVDFAAEYRRRGLSPIPLKARDKKPLHNDWPVMAEVLDWTPYNGCNLGVRMGKLSGGAVDVDLDWPEARELAAIVLPPTKSIFGRPSSTSAHRIYRCAEPPDKATEQWHDPTFEKQADPNAKSVIVEIRSTGGQTMFPPSVHPCGEEIAWEVDEKPANVEIGELRRATNVLAAAALLMRKFPPRGTRFQAHGAVIGCLLRWGVSADVVQEIVRVIAEKFTPRHDRNKRIGAVAKMAADLAAGTGRVPGWKTLKRTFGDKVAKSVRSWLVSHGDGAAYQVIGGRICYMKQDPDGLVTPVPLANFSAQIAEDQVLDDGASEDRRYLLEGSLADGFPLAPITVPVDKFAGVAWVDRGWGAAPIVNEGAGVGMICTAIKSVSVIRVRRIYSHLGWRRIDDELVYLHAGGAIGRGGPVAGVDVEIGGELDHMRLPEVCDARGRARSADAAQDG